MKLKSDRVLLYFISLDVMTLVVFRRVQYVSSGLECRPKSWAMVGYFLYVPGLRTVNDPVLHNGPSHHWRSWRKA